MDACGNKKAKLRSASCITDLNDDCLSAILNRISFQSVLMYKSVCKRWFDLISSLDFVSGFIAHQTRNPPKQTELLLCSYGVPRNLSPLPNYLQLSLSFLPCYDHGKPQNVQIAGSSYDLCLCLDMDKFLCYICNPFTKDWVVLPPLPRKPLLAGFICDPYDGSVGINSDFKYEVVAVLEEYGPNQNSPTAEKMIRGKFFSSESRVWSDISSSFAVNVMLNDYPLISPAVPYGKMVYWPAKNGIIIYITYINRSFFFLPTRTTRPFTFRMCLGLSCDSLWTCQINQNWALIWKMDFVRKEMVLNKVDLSKMNMPLEIRNSFFTTGLRRGFHGEILALSPNDPDVIYLTVDNSFVVSCNLRTGTWYDCGTLDRNLANVVMLSVPYWPTPVPSLAFNLPTEHLLAKK
ncbi:uncharacterized protein LOC126664804 [Mercurialis annua]|uniref:uncharacterized protein LOC126664804 n=1 Tax=Mercurialis annua TaxID=3986 RepID=UPI0021607923|nr:uncharacterized protein LOC126664804 [Mercurialis annua]